MREKMKTANYQNRLITIDQLERQDYQKIYNAGKNGELSCPACHEKVRFYLGIYESPHFFHIHTVGKECPDAIPRSRTEDVEEHFVERDGFRMPQGRTIVEDKLTNELYKAV